MHSLIQLANRIRQLLREAARMRMMAAVRPRLRRAS